MIQKIGVCMYCTFTVYMHNAAYILYFATIVIFFEKLETGSRIFDQYFFFYLRGPEPT